MFRVPLGSDNVYKSSEVSPLFLMLDYCKGLRRVRNKIGRERCLGLESLGRLFIVTSEDRSTL